MNLNLQINGKNPPYQPISGKNPPRQEAHPLVKPTNRVGERNNRKKTSDLSVNIPQSVQKPPDTRMPPISGARVSLITNVGKGGKPQGKEQEIDTTIEEFNRFGSDIPEFSEFIGSPGGNNGNVVFEEFDFFEKETSTIIEFFPNSVREKTNDEIPLNQETARLGNKRKIVTPDEVTKKQRTEVIDLSKEGGPSTNKEVLKPTPDIPKVINISNNVSLVVSKRNCEEVVVWRIKELLRDPNISLNELCKLLMEEELTIYKSILSEKTFLEIVQKQLKEYSERKGMEDAARLSLKKNIERKGAKEAVVAFQSEWGSKLPRETFLKIRDELTYILLHN